MRPCALVIDTSYLWDFFGIPARDREKGETEAERLQRTDQMRQRFKTAAKCDARLYIPYCVIFETANSIAHISDDGLRKTSSDSLIKLIEASINKGQPWIVTPTEGTYLEKEHLLRLCDKFRHSSVNRIGLTDVAIMHEAERLKSKYAIENRHVHIWTADVRLKKEQPDKESNGCPCYKE